MDERIMALGGAYNADLVEINKVKAALHTGYAELSVITDTYLDNQFYDFNLVQQGAAPRPQLSIGHAGGDGGGHYFRIGTGTAASIGWWSIDVSIDLITDPDEWGGLELWQFGETGIPTSGTLIRTFYTRIAPLTGAVNLYATHKFRISDTTAWRFSLRVKSPSETSHLTGSNSRVFVTQLSRDLAA